MPKQILIVEDDALLRRSLAFNLERAGYQVLAAGTGGEGLTLARREHPDLVLLDIGLPDMDGLEAMRRLHAERQVPVIFLTARRREMDEVLGLELGAEDYVTKPFDLDVLLARMKTALRRTQHTKHTPPATGPLVVGDLVIDVSARTVSLGGRAVDLPPRAFDLLTDLASRAGQVVPVEELLLRVWGPEYAGESQVVYVHVRWLREKLETNPNRPSRIVTVRGVGYKLVPQEA